MPLPGGVSLDVFKEILGISRSSEDAMLETFLEGAAGFAATYTRRTLVAEQAELDPAVAKDFPVERATYVRVPDPRIEDVLVVALDGTVLTSDQYQLRTTADESVATRIAGLPWRGLTLTVTARWGFLTLPALLLDALYAHAARNYRERKALYADTVELGAGEGGSALYSYFRQLPPRVRAIYSLYRVPIDTHGL